MKKFAPILLISLNLFSQTDSIFYNFKKHEIQHIDSILRINKADKNLKYLSLLPSFNYDLKNNSVGIGISFSNISTFIVQSKRNEIERDKLRSQLLQELNLNLKDFENTYNEIRNNYEIIQLEKENFNLTQELFNLKKTQYENNKIPLEQWLSIQENHNSKKTSVIAKSKNLAIRMKAFQQKIKSPCFEQELLKLSSSNNNL